MIFSVLNSSTLYPRPSRWMICSSVIASLTAPMRCPATMSPSAITGFGVGSTEDSSGAANAGNVLRTSRTTIQRTRTRITSRRSIPPSQNLSPGRHKRTGGERGETNRSDRHGRHHLDTGRGRERRASVPPPHRPAARGSRTGARRGGGTAGVRLHPWGLHDRAEVGRSQPSGDGDAGPPGGGRGRHHPRDRHARGDGVLPLSHGRLREAGGVHGGDAQRFAPVNTTGFSEATVR